MDDCGYNKFKFTVQKRKKRINSDSCIALAAAVMRKSMFNLLLFLFDVKFCELWTKEVRRLRADIQYV